MRRACASRGRVALRRLADQRGATMVEFALVMPIFFFIVLIGIQLSMLVVQYYSITHVTRQTARWAGINPDTIDSNIAAYARAINLPLVGTDGIASVTVSPSCTTLVSGRCSNRPSGNLITVSITPNVSRATFLPVNFRIGNLSLGLPTTLPAYSVTVMIE